VHREKTMAVEKIDIIYENLEQLQQSVRSGKEAGPIIDDLFRFIRDIVPFMLEVHSLMQESSDSIPFASANLNTISKTTEMATHQVLDQLDVVSAKLQRLRSDLQEEKSNQARLTLIDEVLKDASDIVYALQFQDITSQKLQHVNDILQAIYERFLTLFRSSLRLRNHSMFANGMLDEMVQDQEKTKEQRLKSDFDRQTEDEIHHTHISQDQIDHYFRRHKGHI